MKKSYNIRILGQELSVTSDAKEEDVTNVVKYLSEKMEEVMLISNNLKTLDVAILAALNISEELLQLKGVNKKLCDQLECGAERLIQLIEKAK